MAAEFDDEDSIVTLTVLSTAFVLCFLGFQVLSTPPQRYMAMYVLSEDGTALGQNATALHLGDRLNVLVIVENHMAQQMRIELDTLIAGNASSSPSPWDGGSRLQGQVLTLDDGGRSAMPMTFAVTRASAVGDSIAVEEIELNGVKIPVMTKTSIRNQTLRFIFRALIWSDAEGRYVPEWNDGQEDHASWLQIWFELLPGVGT
mgnify:CR=1 FL=1